MLDQFSRNVYRDTARAFAQDALALVHTQGLVENTQESSRPCAPCNHSFYGIAV